MLNFHLHFTMEIYIFHVHFPKSLINCKLPRFSATSVCCFFFVLPAGGVRHVLCRLHSPPSASIPFCSSSSFWKTNGQRECFIESRIFTDRERDGQRARGTPRRITMEGTAVKGLIHRKFRNGDKSCRKEEKE